jgi:multimeric flavodoxin WrbA
MPGEADPKRVLGIVGSPRRRGNTETLVDEVLRGAEEAGAQVEKVILSELDIGPCRACEACRETRECVQRDDMPALLEQMERSQVWVLGTPIYWWGPTAQFKAFIDRWYGAEYIATFKGRRAILTIPLENTDVGTARHTIGMLTDALDYVKVKLVTTVVAPGVLHRGEVRQHLDVLAQARRAGREAIESESRSTTPPSR